MDPVKMRFHQSEDCERVVLGVSRGCCGTRGAELAELAAPQGEQDPAHQTPSAIATNVGPGKEHREPDKRQSSSEARNGLEV